MERRHYKKIMAQIRMALKVDHQNEEIAKGLFLKVYIEVNLSQALKSGFKYRRRRDIKSTRINYEGVIESCFGCGLTDHKFDVCPKIEKKIGIIIGKKNKRFLILVKQWEGLEALGRRIPL